MRIITCYQDDVTQWPVKSESEPAVYNIWISTCVKISFQLRVKAAKYEIQKPSTCPATLFRCKFFVHLTRSTWPATKTFVAG